MLELPFGQTFMMGHHKWFTFVFLEHWANHTGVILTGASSFIWVWTVTKQNHSFRVAQGMLNLGENPMIYPTPDQYLQWE